MESAESPSTNKWRRRFALRVNDDSLNCFHKIDYKKKDSKMGFEMSLIVVEAIRGRCASFTIITATVSEIFGGQTNSSISVVYDIGR